MRQDSPGLTGGNTPARSTGSRGSAMVCLPRVCSGSVRERRSSTRCIHHYPDTCTTQTILNSLNILCSKLKPKINFVQNNLRKSFLLSRGTTIYYMFVMFSTDSRRCKTSGDIITNTPRVYHGTPEAGDVVQTWQR